MSADPDEANKKIVGAKTTIDVEGGTKRRHDEAVSIRQKERQREMKKRRQDSDDDQDDDPNNNNNGNGNSQNINNGNTDNNQSNDPMAYNQRTAPNQIPLRLLPQFVEMLQSDDDRFVLHGTMMIRKILAVRSDPPIGHVISSGAVPHLVRLLERTDSDQIMFEACWAVSNIASGTSADTMYVIELNAVPRILRQLSCPNAQVREQAAWAVGNFAGESVAIRDLLLHQFNAMPALLDCVNMPTDRVAVHRNTVWAISNLMRHKPHPDLAKVSIALPVLGSLLNHHDSDTVIDACWAIAYCGEGPPERINAVVQSGVIAKLVSFLSNPSWMLQLPALRVFGNLACGSIQQNQVIFSSGASAVLQFLLNHPKITIMKETAWIIGNLLVSNEQMVQLVFQTGVMPDIVRLMRHSNVALRLEAVYTVSNAVGRGTPEQVDFLVQQGLLRCLVNLLVDPNPNVITAALDCLNSLFQCGNEMQQKTGSPSNLYYVDFQQLGGIVKLEDLMEHSNEDVYQLAFELGLEHFPDYFTTVMGANNGNNNNNNNAPAANNGGGNGGGWAL